MSTTEPRLRITPADDLANVSSPEAVGLLVEAVQKLSLARSIPEIQEIVRGAARRLTGADGATFVLREGESCYYADEDAIEPLWKGLRFPLESCISGWAMLNRQYAAIEDIYSDERIPHDAYRPTFVKSLAMVPIRRMDPVGAIGNYWAERHQATPEEMELLQALADSTAVAMENVRVLAELERRVEERTAELESRTRELEDTNRSIQALHDEVTRRAADLAESQKRTEGFLHTMAHEVRGPLAAGTGLLDLSLADGAELDHELREDLSHVRDSINQAITIVTEQLELARLQAGAVRVDTQRVDVATLFDSLRGLYRALRSSEDVALIFEAPVSVPPLETDPGLLGQILRNLLSNALKFTDRGSVRLRADHDAEAGHVVFAVADTGIGIAAENLKRVFEEYGRVDADQDGRPAGTGLGLPLSRRLAEALGGTLDLRSEPGEGSTFTLRLPV